MPMIWVWKWSKVYTKEVQKGVGSLLRLLCNAIAVAAILTVMYGEWVLYLGIVSA